jgi:hypothetical protein
MHYICINEKKVVSLHPISFQSAFLMAVIWSKLLFLLQMFRKSFGMILWNRIKLTDY